tara:strand:- start:8224 stop:10995 length:2772 start_codon:yes stop_codon:yes gene_type:complete
MDREKGLKNKMINISITNKMSDINNNKMIKLVSFPYDSIGDPFQQTWKPQEVSKVKLAKVFTESKKTPMCFFENLITDGKIKPFYDVDVFLPDLDETSDKAHIELYIESVRSQAGDFLKKYYPDGDIAISSSHGNKKKEYQEKGEKKSSSGYAVSFHMVVNEYETTVQDLKKFNKDNKMYDFSFENIPTDHKEQVQKIIDVNVYRKNGCMRLLYSHKPNDSRKKIPETHKEEIMKHLFQSTAFSNSDTKKLPDSPPASPPQSPKKKAKKEEKELPAFEPIIQEKKYDLNEIKDILNCCRNEECYEYQQWLEIGMAIHNITNGDDIGLSLFKDFSKDYVGFKHKKTKRIINDKWKSFNSHEGNKLGMTSLRKLKKKYIKEEIIETSLESIFKYTWETNYQKRLDFYEKNKQEDEEPPDRGMFVKGSIKSVLEKMNDSLIFVKETGEYIILDKKIIVKTDTKSGVVSQKLDKCWYLKNTTKASDHYKKELFNITYQSQGKTKNKLINPFKEWCEWIDRREVRAIDFDPRDNCPDDIFNLWNGFHISKDDCHFAKEEDAKPVLDHILKSWCDGDKDHYEYVLNYFAHVLQKPHKKMGVLLALQSKEGGGKGFILDKMAEIIGDSHYCQNSNAKFLFGDFNGQLEGKILVNLDEAFWGGDKQLEGIVKNKITEQRQTINKKNKENYMISCFANYIITTNNAWFCGANADSRRMFCLKLNNFLSGIVDTDEKDKYIKSILDSPSEAFAKILYNRDISEFNPRKFKKTDLLQNQVERNWNSVLAWWNGVIKDGGFTYNNDFIEWGKLHENTFNEDNAGKCGIPIKDKQGKKHTAYLKSWIHSVYMSVNSDTRKFQDNRFYDDIRNDCMADLYNEKKIQKKKERRIYLILPSLEDARKKWNVLQEFEYKYEDDDEDEFVFDSDDSDSDDE